MQQVMLVSSPLPNGLSWLLNCLLELGIRTTGYGAWWTNEPEGSRMYPVWIRHNHCWYLPILHRQDRFCFREDLEVFWDHQLSLARFPARKTILVVRDLRDSAYSLFRRRVALGQYQNNEADLLRFLQQPESWPELGSLLFDLPVADTLAYFNLCCFHQVPPGQLLVLRFEDCKREPFRQLQRVMDFLELRNSPEALWQAISQSASEQALRISEKMQKLTGTRQIASRGGQVEEWRTRLSPQALACFRGPAELALQTFAYPPLPDALASASTPPLRPDFVPLLSRFQQELEHSGLLPAEALVRQQLAGAGKDPELQSLLAGQGLALLWTRKLMGVQEHLPAASRMASLFSALNAHYGHLPQIRRAATAILNPAHALHYRLSHPKIYRAGDADPGTEFAQAARQAMASGCSLFLWQEPGVLLTDTGLWQLCGLLDGPVTDLVAAIPVLQSQALDSAAQRRALTLQWQTRWGAEFQPVCLTALPACMLFLTGRLAELPLDQPPERWLPALMVHQALGVPAWPAA